MKKLSQLLESINEIDSLLELDFKDKKAFQKYQSIHKMKPTTKVNIAGKDTTVGDETGDDSETPQAPKKTTGADIEKQADKSGKAQDDIEKDIAGDLMGDEPKSDKAGTKAAIDSALKRFNNEVDLDSFEDNPASFDSLQDIANDLEQTPIGQDPEFDKLYDDLMDNQDTESAENFKKYLDDQLKVDEPKSDDDDRYAGAEKDDAVDSALERFNNEVDLDSFEDNPASFDSLQDIANDLEQTPIGEDPEFRELYDDLMDNQDTESAENLKKYLDDQTPKAAFRAPKYDTEKTKKGTGSKKPSSLDSYYAKEDAKKKWLSSNPGKTSYDWSRLPYGTMSDLISKEMKARGFKENINLKELSKITTRYTNRLDEVGFPNQLRRGFIDHSKSSAHGYAIEEVDAILEVYKEITELLTYGKFYDNKKPNRRRLDLSALVADINTAVIGQKRLGGYQNKFEAIFKKFTNMINTQLKREEKGQKADYIKALRASQLDQVKSIFKNSTMTSVRKQKDLY